MVSCISRTAARTRLAAEASARRWAWPGNGDLRQRKEEVGPWAGSCELWAALGCGGRSVRRGGAPMYLKLWCLCLFGGWRSCACSLLGDRAPPLSGQVGCSRAGNPCLLSLGLKTAAAGVCFGDGAVALFAGDGRCGLPRMPCEESGLRMRLLQGQGLLSPGKKSPWHFAYGRQRPWVCQGAHSGRPAWRVPQPRMDWVIACFVHCIRLGCCNSASQPI